MTDRLYYQDAGLDRMEAEVTSCTADGGRWRVTLDRTVFYPEGGGQPADRGILGGRKVLDVQEEEGEVVHFTGGPLDEGDLVTGIIDMDYRFDLMQQHSGEHMVSGMIHSMFGYDNVGFHMGESLTTVDVSGVLTPEQVMQVEDRVNRYIWEDHPVRIWTPPAEELSSIAYRSKKELEDPVRLVAFPGADCCACCGLHVPRSGMVGLARILSVHRFREGVRMEMVFGRRALTLLGVHERENAEIGRLLSVPADRTAKAVEKLKKEIYDLKGALMEEENRYSSLLAGLCRGSGNKVIFLDPMEPQVLRKCADTILSSCRGILAVLAGNDEEGYKYVLAQKDGDVRDLVKEMNQCLNGRGGGKPFFAQGSLACTEEKAGNFFAGQGFTSVKK